MAKSQNLASGNILKVALVLPVYRLFDYLPPEGLNNIFLAPGQRLEVPFGAGKKIGFLIQVGDRSEIPAGKLKPALTILDEKPLLSPQDIRLLDWASAYYHYPSGEVFSAAFPVLLRKGKGIGEGNERYYSLTGKAKTLPLEQLNRSPKQKQLLAFFQQKEVVGVSELRQWNKKARPALKALIEKKLVQETDGLPAEGKPNSAISNFADPDNEVNLNAEQQSAVESVAAGLNKFSVNLLDGVTGSGKTEVYIRIIGRVLERGQQVLVLVPEINLTPQLEERFRQRFATSIAVSHSNLTDKQRYSAWLAVQQGSSAIMLGTRSVLFAPLKNLGLIILDEEHDSSFKQQEGFRFSARDAAVMRGKILNIPVLLGSATPSLESLYNADRGRYQHLILNQRAGNAVEPDLHLLDIRNKKMQHGLSEALLAEIREVLNRGEQVLIFLNRRGFAPALICHGCGWVARCRQCDANMVIHSGERKLRCHHCAREQRLISECPACGGTQLQPIGLGTERIEEGLRTLFPDKVLVRLDRDTTQRKGALERHLGRINSGEADIILGTQMLAKGHHFPDVTLVAIVDVDGGLFSIDFHAAEKLAQMIVQVAGRAGRADKPGKVILQTRHPDHPLLNTLIKEGYRPFAQLALAERKQASLPPFSYQALLRAQAIKPALPLAFLKAAASVSAGQPGNLQIFGPVAAPMEKRAGLHRYQLLFQSRKRADLHHCLDQLIAAIDRLPHVKQIHWNLDVDPVDLF